MGCGVANEYRVKWKRVGLNAKRKRYVSRKRAEYMVELLTCDDPWRLRGEDADKQHCCSGYECGCAGMTNREFYAEQLAGMPEIEYVRLEVREVGQWSET